jgi:hypothetical protein
MVTDPIRTIIVPILLLTVIVGVSAYLYTEGFANERDPTCPVGSYNKNGVPCSGKNSVLDSTGDLPNSYSGAPDPTCPKGSGTSKKTGGPCTGANTGYNYGTATATSNLFGNAGGSLIPTTRTVPTNRVLASISKSDISYNPVIPVLNTSDDMYSIFRFVSDGSDNSVSTDASANPILNSLLAATAAPAKATKATKAATATTATTATTGPSTNDIKSMIHDEVVGQLASGQGCPVAEEEEEECDSSVSMKQGRDALQKRCKPYVATNHIPCWGC